MVSKLYKKLQKAIRLLRTRGKEPYLSLSKVLGFYPDNLDIYEMALLHKSSSIETDDGKWLNNERLEFLGDGILDGVVADIVYKRYPNKREGFLTNARSKIVQRETMNRIAVQLGLDRMVVFSAKLTSHNNHMYGNALEALIGAIYLDQGFEASYKFIEEIMIDKHIELESFLKKEVNYKSSLIEWGQKNRIVLTFNLIESFIDNDGNPVFQTAVILFDEQIGIGIGYSKKESQQAAAKMASKRIKSDKKIQQKISNIKKSKTGEPAGEKEFNELPIEED